MNERYKYFAENENNKPKIEIVCDVELLNEIKTYKKMYLNMWEFQVKCMRNAIKYHDMKAYKYHYGMAKAFEEIYMDLKELYFKYLGRLENGIGTN